VAAFSVVIDADCLHKLHLRNVLLQLATAGFFRPRWTGTILNEFKESLRRRGVVEEYALDLLSTRLSDLYPDSEVKGFEHLIGTLACPDPNDEHVLAAAIVEKAGAIVTCNGRDFPRDCFEKFGVEILHPDDFLMDQVDLNSEVVITSIAVQIESYSKPEADAVAFASYLTKAGCPAFGEFIFSNQRKIDDLVRHLRVASKGLNAADK
jgi:predicted nucleic acid-binding protein